MELKNAAAVCLISLFSATLVVLIARSLDLQAAARIEPQLERIAGELEAIRQGGGIAASPSGDLGGKIADGLIVYYFHGERCPTCRSIEAQAKKVVETDFAAELADGRMAWKVVDYLKPANKELQEQFNVSSAVVVLVKMKAGEIEGHNRLFRAAALEGKPAEFAEYVRKEIRAMLGESAAPGVGPDAPSGQDIPIPGDIPVP